MKRIFALSIIVLLVIGSIGAVGNKTTKNSEDENESLCLGGSYGFEPSFEVSARSEGQHDPMNYNIGLPEKWDWRDEGLPKARDQGNCGSCWAFGTIGPIECKLWLDNDHTELSEQWLVSCNRDGYSCNGGWWAHEYHSGKTGKCGGTGAVLEADCPYRAQSGGCGDSYDHYYIYKDTDGQYGSWAYVGSQSGAPSVEKIKTAIKQFGPVSAAVAAGNGWSGYSGGVFDNPVTGNVNHGITIVGWDDNMGSNGCWIIRNSWGTGWGDNGYMYHEYNLNKVGYAAAYVDGYERIMSGDPAISVEVYKVSNSGMDDIDTDLDIFRGGKKPEWYYDIGFKEADSSNYETKHMENKYSTQDEDSGFWIWDWKWQHTWEAQQGYVFTTFNRDVDIRFRLCDDDATSDDLADVSGKSGGGKDDDTSYSHTGAIFTGTYDIVDKELTENGKKISKEGDYYVFSGEDDGAGGDQNDAKVWLKITDNYDPSGYLPRMSVDPLNLNFGNMDMTGDTKTKTLYVTITNLQSQSDPLGIADGSLNWAAEVIKSSSSDINWLTINGGKTSDSGTISVSKHDEDISVKVDISALGGTPDGIDYNAKVQVTSDNAEGTSSFDVKLVVSVNKEKAKVKSFIILDIIELFREQFPFLFSILNIVY